MLLHTHHRVPPHSRRPRPPPLRCGHSACAAVARGNAEARAAARAASPDSRARIPGAKLAVVLVSVVGGRAVALLTRADGEAEYTFTAGCRWLDQPGEPSESQWQRDGGCYVRAAATILAMDANIDAALVEERVRFFAAPRLLPSDTPVMIGRVAPRDIAHFDELSDHFDSANTKLFRVNSVVRKWRIVGRPADDRRLVNEATQGIICSTLEQYPL